MTSKKANPDTPHIYLRPYPSLNVKYYAIKPRPKPINRKYDEAFRKAYAFINALNSDTSLL